MFEDYPFPGVGSFTIEKIIPFTDLESRDNILMFFNNS